MLTVDGSKQYYQLPCIFENSNNKKLGKQYNIVSVLWLQQKNIWVWIQTGRNMKTHW